MRTFLQILTRNFQPALLASLLVILVGGAGGPLMLLADSRSEESQENAPVERQEEFTPSARIDHERELKLVEHKLAIVFEAPSEHLGHTQNSVLPAADGHRL